MIKHKWIGRISALLMAAAVLVMGYAYVNPSVFASVTGTAEPAYVSAMDKTKIMSIQIIADEKQWADMLENATAEEYIPATVIINGDKIENVGIRPKGNSSLSMVARDSTTDRFSFKIEFDHYVTGQTWLGLDKLAVNNMQGDASYMKEYLSYDIMDYTGVESPLTAFADISVNGETWGFYLAVETLENSYAQRVYGNDHGMLYKPESMGMRGAGRMNEAIEEMQNAGQFSGQMQPPGEIREPMQDPNGVQGEPTNEVRGQGQLPTADMPNMQQGRGNRGGGFGGMAGMAQGGVSLQYTSGEISDYSAIFENAVFDATEKDYNRIIQSLDKLSRGEDLENTVDAEAVLKYFAAHTVVVNLDSYISGMAHNYYLYEEDCRLTILPWDYNLAFGGFQSGGASDVVNFPIDTPVSGVSLDDRPLLGKLLEVPEYMELYHSYLRQIAQGYFSSGLFEQTIDSLNSLISSHVENDPTAFYDYEAYEAAVIELKKLGLLRAESIEGQLNGTIPSTSAEQNANPDKLIDASGINLSALGSQGGGGGMFGGNVNFGQGSFDAGNNMERQGNTQGIDRQMMQKAMEIITADGDNELSEEQISELKELGLTDEQIAQFRSIQQGGFGGFMGGGRLGDRQENANNPIRANPGFEKKQSGIVSGFDINTWIFIGGCVVLFLSVLLFVARFKRRC